MKRTKLDLVNGNITINLFRLSIPVILTSLITIIYNLVGIKFVSYYLGDMAVSSVTAASFYIALSYAFLSITKNGAMIYVAQSMGSNTKNSAKKYARVSIIIATVLSIVYGTMTFIFAEPMIRLVGVRTPEFLYPAIEFLKISSFGFILLFLSQTIASIINGNGDTLGPFAILSTGIFLNIGLEYLLLGILGLGIKGAAIATLLSQLFALIFLIMYFKRKNSIFRNMRLFKLDDIQYYKNIIRIGIPSAISQALFTLISIAVAQMISNVDESILAVQRLGVQIESFSWNIAGGFASAVATFIGHNYGAKKYSRIKEIYKLAIISISSLCLILTIIFVTFARQIYELFFVDPKLIAEGVHYLVIIGLAQIPQGIESITTGAFNGIGKTREPNLIGIIGSSIRIPIIKVLLPIFGIISIWWTIHFTMVLKGVVSLIIFINVWKKMEENDKIKVA